MNENHDIGNIKSNLVLKKIFGNLTRKKKLKVVANSKKSQSKLNLNLSDYIDTYNKKYLEDICSSKKPVTENQFKALECYDDFQYLSTQNKLGILPIDFLDRMAKNPNIGVKRMIQFLSENCSKERLLIHLEDRLQNITKEVLDQFELDDWETIASMNFLRLFGDKIIEKIENNPKIGTEQTVEFVSYFRKALAVTQLGNMSKKVLSKFSEEKFISFTRTNDFQFLPDNAINIVARNANLTKEQMTNFVLNYREVFSDGQLKNIEKEIIKNFELCDLRRMALQSGDKDLVIRRTDGRPIRSKLQYLGDDLIEIIVKNVKEKKGETEKQRLDFVKKHWNRFSEEQREYAKKHDINFDKNQNIKQNNKNNNNEHNFKSVEGQNIEQNNKDDLSQG